jgi:glycosyltransferase involved in cell wall biosynthesis
MHVSPTRILGETAYPPMAPSARVRLATFSSFLRPYGVELRYRPTLSDHEYRLLSSSRSALRKSARLAVAAGRTAVQAHSPRDLLLVHRLRFLTPLPGIDPPRRLDVYDLDDALFLGSSSVVNRRFEAAKQEARRCVTCLRQSRLVIAGNSFLASHAREHAHRVEVVPSCVDPAGQRLRDHRDGDVVTLGWIGSRTTSAYLEPVLPVFERMNSRRLRVKLVLIGAEPRIRAPWIEHRSWSLANEDRDLASFDIGIMPLPNTDWARGKCGYKLLQYFSAGVPAVASPVGVNPELIGQERGLLADSADEWRRALDEIADDVSGRRQRGAAARAFVERHYSYQRWAPDLAGLLRSLDP